MNRCKTGEILRSGYTRKAHTRKAFTKSNGVKISKTSVKSSKVPPTCIKDLGKKGKGKKILPKLEKGTLSKFGYSSFKPESQRHDALKKALNKLPYATIIRKLNAVAILSKLVNPIVSYKFKKDIAWLRSKFGK
ncbi:MAG TPA: hypothetical protein V6C58_14145 [Allocoleopsis sp.]